MAGTLIVSNITTDTDNTFIVRSNTGTTLFSANTTGIDTANSIAANAITSDKILSVANTKISGLVTASQIANVANTQLTGTLIASQIASVNATTATSGTLPTARLPAGSVLQVVSTTKTDTFSSTGTGDIDITGLSVSITPTSASSKFLIIAKIMIGMEGSQQTAFVLQMRRNNTIINSGNSSGDRGIGFSGSEEGISTSVFGQYQTYDYGGNFLDSPNTTSALTYKISLYLSQTQTFYVNRTAVDGNSVSYPRGTSNITVMEIAG